jgi:hypothetical protein
MSETANNTNRAELLDSLRGEYNRLVVVTGTGVSLASCGQGKEAATSIAGWPGLLTSGLEYCRKYSLVGEEGESILLQQIESRKSTHLIHAASVLHKWMQKRSNGRYHWMQSTVGQLKVTDSKLIHAIQKLGGLISTLNYDSLLTQVTGRKAVNWRQREPTDTYLRTQANDLIYHIHGYWEQVDSVVLDTASYDAIVADQEVRQVMEYFARARTLLFIGCDSTFFDPNFQALLEWGEVMLRGAKYKHFVLCRESELTRMRAALSQYGFLEPLSYGANYDDLTPFLENLATDSGSAATAASPVTAPPAPASTPGENVQRPADLWKRRTQS